MSHRFAESPDARLWQDDPSLQGAKARLEPCPTGHSRTIISTLPRRFLIASYFRSLAGFMRSTLTISLLLAALGCGVSAPGSTTPSTAAVARIANRAVVEAPGPPAVEWHEAPRLANVPEWAVDAVFYQIFPERFCNGDSSNDPTHESLEFPDITPANWTVTPWTADWYARADWEQQSGKSFCENGVFNRRFGGDPQGVLEKLD